MLQRPGSLVNSCRWTLSLVWGSVRLPQRQSSVHNPICGHLIRTRFISPRTSHCSVPGSSEEAGSVDCQQNTENVAQVLLHLCAHLSSERSSTRCLPILSVHMTEGGSSFDKLAPQRYWSRSISVGCCGDIRFICHFAFSN